MKSFSQFISEKKDPSSDTLHAFDIDDTLFHHDNDKLKVHVTDPSGKRVKSLTNQEFNTHRLDPDHKYDFSDFKSSDVFNKTAKPIRGMIAKMKAIHKNNKNVEILTARSDFDDKDKFAKKMGDYGIDINKIHVRRAGNQAGVPPAEAKRRVLSGLIKKEGYKHVHLYDDSKANIDAALSLKRDHPDVAIHGHHVEHQPDGSHKITTYTA